MHGLLVKWSALLTSSFVERWGWTWFQTRSNAWKKLHSGPTKRIEELENPIKKLENNMNQIYWYNPSAISSINNIITQSPEFYNVATKNYGLKNWPRF